jgi:hypothetical protein
LAQLEESEMVGVRMPKDLKKSLREAARRSGWSVSEQIRYELSQPRGLWKPHEPWMPHPTEPSRPSRDRFLFPSECTVRI